MSRKEENRKHVRKRRQDLDSDYDDLGEERSLRSNRREYESSSYNRSRERSDRDMYNYSAFDNRYRGWRNIYDDRSYYRDYEPYGYRSRGGYYTDDYYDGYYDDYYGGSRGGSDCFACNRRGEKRWGRMYDDPYVFRSEEDRGGNRYLPEGRRERHSDGPSRRSRRVTLEPSETDPPGNRNDMNVYAVPNVSGQDGFKDKTYNKPKPVRPDVSREVEHDPRSRGRPRGKERRGRPRSRRPDYEYDEYDDC